MTFKKVNIYWNMWLQCAVGEVKQVRVYRLGPEIAGQTPSEIH